MTVQLARVLCFIAAILCLGAEMVHHPFVGFGMWAAAAMFLVTAHALKQ